MRRHNTTCHKPRTAPQNVRRQDSPRPPDANEVARHAITRTSRRCPKSRRSPNRGSNRPNDTTVIDLTTPHALRRRPRIQFSDNHDRHARFEQTATTEVIATASQGHANTVLQNHINVWRTQIIPEQTPLTRRYYSIQTPRLSVAADGHFTFAPDPRNYAYDYDYSDSRRQN
ncbi:hypothetical protein EDB85DRAFT_2023823 [Lactarius pseudohatsudake]|nr:hypothetical protein EDB85DRAFT_2023823 [Lactarius pseudohatsudake]